MSPNQRQWEDLNSYVDGELAPASSARVAAEAASDPSVAGSIATLHAIKNALGTAYTQDTVVIATPSKAGMGGRRGLQAAAYAALALGFLTLAFIWRHDLGVGSQVPDGRATVGQALNSAPQAWTASGLPGARIEVPDISAAGLNPEFVENTRAANGVAMAHIGYLGRHGCRLNLFIAPKAAAGDATALFPDSQLQIANWANDTSRFFAVAKGMDDARFAVITAALKAVTTDPKPMDNALQVALSEAHQPCTS